MAVFSNSQHVLRAKKHVKTVGSQNSQRPPKMFDGQLDGSGLGQNPRMWNPSDLMVPTINEMVSLLIPQDKKNWNIVG